MGVGVGVQSQNWGSILHKMPYTLGEGMRRVPRGDCSGCCWPWALSFAVAFPTVYYHPESFLDKGSLQWPWRQQPAGWYFENAASGPGTLGSEDYI